MRYAFISDIHGNLQALEVVLAALQKTPVDQIICLGDVASLGPQPREVIACLREHHIPVVLGNHDAYLLNLALTENHHPWLRAAEAWCLTQLSAADLDFLRAAPLQRSLPLAGDATLLCFHGSPRSNEEFIFPLAPAETLDEIFARHPAQVFVGGHTHVQTLRQHQGRLWLNPGSVGMPFVYPKPGPDQRILRRAEYAMVEMKDGALSVTLHQLPIDFARLAATARASGLPEVEVWVGMWEA